MAFKISTKGRYGLRALVDLAANSNGRPVLLADIARRQGVSKRYLERLFTRMRRGGLIRSVRGASGGYLLAHDPREVSLVEVIELLEGPIRHADCDGRQPGCRRREKCVAFDLWADLADTIRAKLAAITLEDLRLKNEAITAAEAGRWEI